MSKWGYVDAATARRKFESSPEEAGEMVREMSNLIIGQEKAISDLKDSLIAAQRNEGLARASEAHMAGYIQRVRDMDPKPKEKKR